MSPDTHQPNERTTPPAFLAGVRVLDITGALAGPYCTTILNDLGAEVIKVEPVSGDRLRKRDTGTQGKSLPFSLVHRGKKSFAIDIKSHEGRRLVRELAATADVLVENFRVGALSSQGLAYEDLKDECPDLVYCSISGFGQFGPMRDAKGVDLIAQAYGGLMSVTGSNDGTIAKTGFPMADLGAGMWAAIGVLAALRRVREGQGGAYIDISLADTIAGWSLWEVADYLGTGEIPRPLGTTHRLAAPHQAFNCRDGQPLVVAGIERQWPRLCDLLDIDLSGDGRFDTEYQRFQNRDALAEILQSRFSTDERDAWVQRLRTRGVPCGPVQSIDQVLDDPQFQARNLFPQQPDLFGQPRVVNTPIVTDGAPRARAAAPAVGSDTHDLLLELGLAHEDIERLRNASVVAGEDADDEESDASSHKNEANLVHTNSLGGSQ